MTRSNEPPAGSGEAAVTTVPASVIFRAFLRLGLTSFGGPVAHLGYFRAEFVDRRRWLRDAEFADLVALCQFLPGPASSQTGFGIGLLRSGVRGGLAAWAGFTLPSAVLMVLFAYAVGELAGAPLGRAVLHGVRLAAVAIVAQAVLGMARSICVDRLRASIAAFGVVLAVAVAGSAGQVAAIVLGAVVARLFLPAGSGAREAAGQVARRANGEPPSRAGSATSSRAGSATPSRAGSATPSRAGRATPSRAGRATGCLAAFAVLLAITFLPASGTWFGLWNAFYRAGALVFGGGHVVLPLLHDAVVSPGWVSDDRFVAGYGVAQALPGPLFTFAAFLGAAARPPLGGIGGAVVALVAIFLPGLLLLLGILPFSAGLRARATVRAAMDGANAAVVGILAAALYDPVWVGAVARPRDVATVAVAFVLLVASRASPVLVVAGCGGAGALIGG